MEVVVLGRRPIWVGILPVRSSLQSLSPRERPARPPSAEGTGPAKPPARRERRATAPGRTEGAAPAPPKAQRTPSGFSTKLPWVGVGRSRVVSVAAEWEWVDPV